MAELQGQPVSSLKDGLLRFADDYACAAYASQSVAEARQSQERSALADAICAVERKLADLIAERDELAQQRGDLAAQVLELQEARGLLARLHLATGGVTQGAMSDGEIAFLRGARMRAGQYLRQLNEDSRPVTVASDSQPSEMPK